MESWCFDSLDTGYVSNESLSQSGSIIRTKDELNCWGFKVPSSYDDSVLANSQQSMENHGFSEDGLSEMMRKQFPVGDIVSSSMVISNLVSREEESSSKVSSSVVDSSSQETSQIDLKLGGFSDNLKCSSSRIAPCSSESSTRVKRVRGTSFGSQIVYCQVHGCCKDLSSAKDYHKRHKVCDAHSKTSKVVVNGIEQRFCQQCSRFHLLGEFDDGKRSCRKRLAGHNQRRRKPQVGYNNGRAGRYFSYAGSVGGKFQVTTIPAASYNCQDTLPGSASHAVNGWSAHVKIEDEIDFSQKSSNIFRDGQFWTQYSSIDSTSDNKSQSVLGETVSHMTHEKVSRSFVQMNSLGSEDVTPFNIASTIQGLPGISESGCALSLLSYQSQNSPDHPSGIPGAHTLVIPNTSPHYNVNEVSEKIIGVGSWGLTSGNQNKYSMGRNNESANSSFGNEALQGSEFMNANSRMSCEEGTTVNLLQLSSQLQRVENQRQTATGKQETERF